MRVGARISGIGRRLKERSAVRFRDRIAARAKELAWRHRSDAELRELRRRTRPLSIESDEVSE